MFSFCYCPQTVKDEVVRSKGQANQLLEIPGASAVIVESSSGKEVLMLEGTLKFIVLGEPSTMALLFMGDSFDNQEEGFYYPLLDETPVCLTGDSVLTMDAEDGDVFGIRLPEKSGKLKELAELLDEHCELINSTATSTGPGKLEKTGTAVLKSGRSDHKCNKPESTGQSVQLAAQLKSGLMELGKQAGEALKDEKTQAALLAAATAIGSELVKKGVKGSKSASAGGGTSGSAASAASSTNKSGAGGKMMKGVANEAVMTLLMTAGEKIISEQFGANSGSKSSAGGSGGGKEKGLSKMGTQLTKELVELVGKEEAKHLALKAAKYTAKNLMKKAAK